MHNNITNVGASLKITSDARHIFTILCRSAAKPPALPPLFGMPRRPLRQLFNERILAFRLYGMRATASPDWLFLGAPYKDDIFPLSTPSKNGSVTGQIAVPCVARNQAFYSLPFSFATVFVFRQASLASLSARGNMPKLSLKQV
jgi:hypothetical protein